jgi:hypothetical protein
VLTPYVNKGCRGSPMAWSGTRTQAHQYGKCHLSQPRTSSQQSLRSSRRNECIRFFRRDSQTRSLGQGVHDTKYMEGQAIRVHPHVGAGAVLLLALGAE